VCVDERPLVSVTALAYSHDFKSSTLVWLENRDLKNYFAFIFTQSLVGQSYVIDCIYIQIEQCNIVLKLYNQRN